VIEVVDDAVGDTRVDIGATRRVSIRHHDRDLHFPAAPCGLSTAISMARRAADAPARNRSGDVTHEVRAETSVEDGEAVAPAARLASIAAQTKGRAGRHAMAIR
jgi:hypothetical protein